MGEIKSVFVFVGADEMNLRGVERGRVSTGLPLRLLRGRETPLRCRRSSANLLLWRRSGVVGGGRGEGGEEEEELQEQRKIRQKQWSHSSSASLGHCGRFAQSGTVCFMLKLLPPPPHQKKKRE